MRPTLLAMVMGLLIGGALAADDTLSRYDPVSGTSKATVLKDLGSSQYALAVADLLGPNGSYTYTVGRSSFPTTVTLTGLGRSWLVDFQGGGGTFQVNDGSTVTAASGQSFSDTFWALEANPEVEIISLDSGATAQVVLSGVTTP